MKLHKPTSDEKYNVQTQNTNMDILDTSIKALQDKDTTLARQTDFISHRDNKNNPHNVTKEQLGLSNVVNQRQIPAIQANVTDEGIPVFDGNGYTLKDSGFTIGKSIPEDAEFTDTLYVHPESNVYMGEYTRVSVDSYGHVTYGSNPTTLYEYGITDAAPIDHSHTAEEIGADVAGSADNALNQAKEYTDLKVTGQHGENVLKKQIVEFLPTQDIDINTIYLVLKQDASGNDNYNEYINLDGTSNGYEWIGNTFVDLRDYYNKVESNNLFLLKTNIVNNLTTTDGGKALDARQGKSLDTRIISNSNSIAGLNRNLYYQCVDFSRFKDNLLLFDSSSFYTEENKTVRFAYTASNAPISDPTFRGIWKLNWFGTNQVMVELIEFLPVPGRRWTNHYFAPNWSGWTSTMPYQSTYFTVSGTLTEIITQVFSLPTQNGKAPYLLSAQIQLSAGVWSDLRTLPKVVQIAANSLQVALTKDAAASYVGYQVRFLFMVGD